MPRPLKTTLLVSFVCFIHLFSGCKKDDNPVDEQKATYQLSSTSASPMQIVMLESSRDVFTDASYKGTLGSREVIMHRVDENTLALMIPDSITQGSQSLALNLPGQAATFPLMIEAAPAPLTSGQLTNMVNETIGRMDGYIAQADSIADMGWMPEADRQHARNLKDSLTKHLQQFKNASPEVQKYALMYMAANAALNDKLNKALSGYTSLGYKKNGGFFDLAADMAGYVLPPLIGAGVAIVAAPPALVTGVAVTGAIGAGALLGWNIDTDMLSATLTKAKNLFTQSNNTTNIPEKVGVNQSVIYYDGEPEFTSVQLQYRSVQESDESSVSETISGYVKNFRALKKEWKGRVSEFCGDLPGFVVKKGFDVAKNMSSLKVRTVNQPSMSVTVSGTPAETKLTFSASDKKSQSVQVEYTYDDGIGLPPVTKTAEAYVVYVSPGMRTLVKKVWVFAKAELKDGTDVTKWHPEWNGSFSFNLFGPTYYWVWNNSKTTIGKWDLTEDDTRFNLYDSGVTISRHLLEITPTHFRLGVDVVEDGVDEDMDVIFEAQ